MKEKTLFAMLLVFWLFPVAIGVFDAILWFFSANFNIINWNAGRSLFVLMWTIIGVFVVSCVAEVQGS